MEASAKIEMREVYEVLGKLKTRLAKSIIAPSLRRAAKPVTTLARSNLTATGAIETGQLKKSLGVKVKRYKDGVWAGVGPRSGFKIMHDGKPRNPTQYAHLVELGTVRSAAKPFLRPAHESTKGQQFSEFVSKAKAEFTKRNLTTDTSPSDGED